MLGPAMPTPHKAKKPSTKARAKHARVPDPVAELIEALADVVADRVVAKLAAKDKTPPMPEMVPMWLMPSREPGAKRRTVRVGKDATPEQTLRAMGLVKHGEPGYEKALREYLATKQAHEAELAARAQVRRAARLLRKLAAVAE